jgi:peptidyl-prolyl cis-trans isomerase C
MMFGMTLAALSLGVLALSLPAHAQQAAPAEDPVVAIVDGTQVHRSEVEAVARSLPEQYRQVPLPQIYGMLLDRTIDFRLLARAAEQTDLAQASCGTPSCGRKSSKPRPRTSCARATTR